MLGTPADNAGGVEWDQQLTAPLAPGATAAFALSVRAAPRPPASSVTPPRAAGPQGVPIAFTATARDAAGAPLAGRTVRFSVAGANPATQQAVTDAAGNAVLVDPGADRGADTVVAFVDLNGDGVRERVGAAGVGARVVRRPGRRPTCTVRIAGDRSLGRRERLVVAVRCDERVTVGRAAPRWAGGASRRARRRRRRQHRPPARRPAGARAPALRRADGDGRGGRHRARRGRQRRARAAPPASVRLAPR